jgi:hypothetical protein
LVHNSSEVWKIQTAWCWHPGEGFLAVLQHGRGMEWKGTVEGRRGTHASKYAREIQESCQSLLKQPAEWVVREGVGAGGEK